MWASAHVSVGERCWEILNFITAPIIQKLSVKNIHRWTVMGDSRQALHAAVGGRDTVQFWQLCKVQTSIKTISARDMFYTALKMSNGRKAFSYATAYSYLVKRVAQFSWHMCLTILFLPIFEYLAYFYAMTHGFCHVARWTFSSKVQLIWKHNVTCHTPLQISTYIWVIVGMLVFFSFLVLVGSIVLTILDNVAARKSLSLNSGKSVFLWFVLFSCKRRDGCAFSALSAVTCPLSGATCTSCCVAISGTYWSWLGVTRALLWAAQALQLAVPGWLDFYFQSQMGLQGTNT